MLRLIYWDPGLIYWDPADIDELVQERRNSSALAVELRLSCTNPLPWSETINRKYVGYNVDI